MTTRRHRQQGLPLSLDCGSPRRRLIRLGEFDMIVAGGMESMTSAPHVLKGSRRATSTAPSR